MSRKLCSLLGCGLATLAVLAPVAVAQPTTVTVTATGTGQSRVLPKNRHRNASIVAAYAAARKKAITGAISAAHENALDYASAAGLTLGDLVSLSDEQNNGFIGYGPFGIIGPFGPGKFCGTVRTAKVKRVDGKLKVVRTRKVHRCFVPAYADTTLVLTYDASSNSSS